MRQVCREKQSTKSIDRETSGKHKPFLGLKYPETGIFSLCFMVIQLATQAEPILYARLMQQGCFLGASILRFFPGN